MWTPQKGSAVAFLAQCSGLFHNQAVYGAIPPCEEKGLS
jgi:hypothetical protein